MPSPGAYSPADTGTPQGLYYVSVDCRQISTPGSRLMHPCIASCHSTNLDMREADRSPSPAGTIQSSLGEPTYSCQLGRVLSRDK